MRVVDVKKSTTIPTFVLYTGQVEKDQRKAFPDPFKANLSEIRNNTQVKRKAPKQRHEAVVKNARKQLKADSEVETPDVL